jgi:hypothetical protein
METSEYDLIFFGEIKCLKAFGNKILGIFGPKKR